MDLSAWFWFAHAVALAGWIALLFAPIHRDRMVRIARTAAAILAVGYMLTFLLNTSGLKLLATDYSVGGISKLFQNPHLALLGWIHYLAFDLWVGTWETEAAGRATMPHSLLVPCLLLTCALGPLGLLLFLGIRQFLKDRGRAPERPQGF